MLRTRRAHVSQAFNDLSSPNAHDVYPSNPVRLVLAPAEFPADDPAVLAGPNLLCFEDKIRRGCDALPEIEACLTPVVSRAVWSWRRIFENAAFTNQIVEISGAVRLKRVMETFNDFAGNLLLMFIFSPH